MSGFHKGECTCTHTAQRHKRSGHCRNGCECKAAELKARRKGKK